MKIKRLIGILIAALFLAGTAMLADAAKAPISLILDSYGFYVEEGGIIKEFPAPIGVATIKEKEDGTEISIEAKGLPVSCEFKVYTIDQKNEKTFSVVKEVHTFRSDEGGRGQSSFTIPLQQMWPPLLSSSGIWSSIEVKMNPDCARYTDISQKVLALDLGRAIR